MSMYYVYSKSVFERYHVMMFVNMPQGIDPSIA